MFVAPEIMRVPGLSCFVGYVDDEPVATALGHVASGLQHVECVSTVAEHRRRGYGEALTWAATTLDPTLPAVLISSDQGRPVYQRMGYLAVDRWVFWIGERR